VINDNQAEVEAELKPTKTTKLNTKTTKTKTQIMGPTPYTPSFQ
jgi:hypothetical protein